MYMYLLHMITPGALKCQIGTELALLFLMLLLDDEFAKTLDTISLDTGVFTCMRDSVQNDDTEYSHITLTLLDTVQYFC